MAAAFTARVPAAAAIALMLVISHSPARRSHSLGRLTVEEILCDERQAAVLRGQRIPGGHVVHLESHLLARVDRAVPIRVPPLAETLKDLATPVVDGGGARIVDLNDGAIARGQVVQSSALASCWNDVPSSCAPPIRRAPPAGRC